MTPAARTEETSHFPTAGSLSHSWRALRHRNFQLFFFGQSISVIGTWMTKVATSWLVYRLTGSALLLGLVGFAGQIVSFALGPIAGVWVERLNRRKLLVWTQAAAAVQSLALAVLTLTHVITLWEIIALTTLQGLINALDNPGRQAFLIEMVENPAVSRERHRHQLLDGERCTNDWSNHRGPGDRDGRRRLVLSDRRLQLSPCDRFPAHDATPPSACPTSRVEHVRADARGVGLRSDVSSDPHGPAAVLVDEPDGISLHRPAAALRPRGSARRTAHTRLAHRRVGHRRAGLRGCPSRFANRSSA